MRASLPLFVLTLSLAGCSGKVETRLITSASMSPSLLTGDKIITEQRVSYKRMAIISFQSPFSFDSVLSTSNSSDNCWLAEAPILGKSAIKLVKNSACETLVARIIAMPGERVAVDSNGRVFINGKPLVEPYVKNYCRSIHQRPYPCPSLDKTVPERHVFVLGDNRGNSWDGRYWPGGSFLPKNRIRGVATSIYLPLSRKKIL